ncbi:NEDD8-activating enzyme E1 catalytic subunit isoform X3 [Scleropages formosus]|uniref:NEDD8-activating enzyme E1 catalytic subunit isoform X3 n=1 Tax=Scleropages formosus TaxID=113540 RepID=UPI0010FA679B|nr:NEDD8-activating enzyme E1 catalytic subunit isoform X3 [Scleropages formosus]
MNLLLFSLFREKKRRRIEELAQSQKKAVDGGNEDSQDWDGRWNHVKKFLERSGPFTHPDFEPSTESLQFLLESCKILVIGAGGLGCELLKNLALSGFRKIHIVDMDTIDVSNLNRQFLFRPKDVGRPKADVAADFINSRVPGCNVVPHFKKIQVFDESFYRQFHIIVCGLDSIIARRWINGMLMSLLIYEGGVLDTSTIIPLIDGGTEGFKGNARVVLPGMTACIDCTLELYPPQINFPMCTIATMPRLPEHCIEYVHILQWPKEKPFGDGVALDGDDPQHIQWVFQRSQERAAQFNITGVTYRLTQGVVKRIIPAVASTNAVIAAACASEVFKIASSTYIPLNNYLVFNDVDGLYTYTFEAERKGFLFLYGAAATPGCNTPCEDGLRSTPVESGEDRSGHLGFLRTPEKAEASMGLFDGRCRAVSPLLIEVSATGL